MSARIQDTFDLPVSDECMASSTRTVAGEAIPRPTPIARDGVGQVAQDETEGWSDYFLQQGERDRLNAAIRQRLNTKEQA